MAWNRWSRRPWRTIDVSAIAIMVLEFRWRLGSLGARDQRQPVGIRHSLCRDWRTHRTRRGDACSCIGHPSVDDHFVLR